MKKLFISGMNCGHCEAKVKNALNSIGALNVDVNLEDKTVTFNCDRPNEDIIEVIADYGFDVDKIE